MLTICICLLYTVIKEKVKEMLPERHAFEFNKSLNNKTIFFHKTVDLMFFCLKGLRFAMNGYCAPNSHTFVLPGNPFFSLGCYHLP